MNFPLKFDPHIKYLITIEQKITSIDRMYELRACTTSDSCQFFSASVRQWKDWLISDFEFSDRINSLVLVCSPMPLGPIKMLQTWTLALVSVWRRRWKPMRIQVIRWIKSIKKHNSFSFRITIACVCAYFVSYTSNV